ncbi:MAG: TIGR02996 domain-containing protein [Deltaproteobacteria bacterium]|nr:TIGR02996 domain-containing protein [Deltaproteobacteria bacterium]
MTPETLLDRAALSLERGEYAIALPILIAQWRVRKAPELGDLIDRVDERVTGAPFEGSTDRWLAAAAVADDLSRGPLLRAIPKRTLEDTQRVLDVATEWDDPRLTRILRGLLVELPWTGRRSRDGWREIFRFIASQRDPRLVELVHTLPPTWTIGEEMQRFLTKLLTSAVKPVAIAPWPEAAALGALLGVTPSIVTKAETEADLLARIYEHPEDDAPRAVYADWLLERENPRGEFIVLQLRPDKDDAATKRELALLKKHQKAWLGPMEPVIRAVELRRGFPASATIKFRHQRDVDQFGHHAAWATLEELSWTYSQARDDRLDWTRAMTPAMSGLRIAHQPSLTQLLGATRPWRIERCEIDQLDATQFQSLLGHPLLPALRELSIGYSVKPSWFNGIVKCPPHLEMIAPLDSIDREVFVAKAEATPVETLTFVWSYYRGRFSRDDTGKLSRLDVATTIALPSLDVLPKATIATIDSALKQIKFRTLTHVDVTATIGGERISIAHLVEQTKRIRR